MSGKDARPESIAAFFDVDGVLLPKPSLELRFARSLRKHGFLGPRNYLYWFARSARLASRGMRQVLHGNKAYLRGIAQAHALASAEWLRDADDSLLFDEAIERATWHARQGHRIALITGTIEPLALRVAEVLRAALRRNGGDTAVHVHATKLAEKDSHWSGEIAGKAMFGEEKARMVEQLAAEWRLDLAECFAYGDGANDRWMLARVGYPAAVNPSGKLLRIAGLSGWPVIHWTETASRAQANTRHYSGRPQQAGVQRVARNSAAVGLPEIPQ